jgi:hypothetical protein
MFLDGKSQISITKYQTNSNFQLQNDPIKIGELIFAEALNVQKIGSVKESTRPSGPIRLTDHYYYYLDFARVGGFHMQGT